MLAERHGFLGGMGTAAGLSCYLNHRLDGSNVADAVYREFVGHLTQAEAHYNDPGAQADFFEPEACKQIMEGLLRARGTRLLYNALLQEVGWDHTYWRARFWCKGAQVAVRARYFIDATGDGDAAFLAGLKMTHGRQSDGATQPMSMIVQLGGFDPSAWAQAGGRVVNGRFASGGDCFAKEIAIARAQGDWNIPRSTIAMFWSMPSDPTRVTINGTRVQGFNSCNPLEVSEAEVEGRRQAMVLWNFFKKYIPGFAASYLIATGPQIGVRESRRIVGRATLTEQSVRAGERSPSSVVYCAYPIDIHEPDGVETHFEMGTVNKIYGIPWECLLPETAVNFAAAGRCISATHEAAGSFRVMPTCMGLGEAAGSAVALAHARGQCILAKVSGEDIRAAMELRHAAAQARS